MRELLAVLALIGVLMMFGCGESGSQNSVQPPVVSMSDTTAMLTWNSVDGYGVTEYRMYWGKESTGTPGSCAYPNMKATPVTEITITDLDPDTIYYFAVSAFNGLESPCSEEVSALK